MSEIKAVDEFYNGRTVFITGATGFMGKVLLEKLLYGCPSIKRIYILLRPKRCSSINARLDAMFQLPLFDRVRSTDPNLLQKVVPIDGDVTLPDLGVHKKDKTRIIQEVSIVFHCAASLKLEGKLKDLANINLAGTQRLLNLCYEIPQLKIFIHVSTAFCHVDVAKMAETIYSSDVNPEDVIGLTQWLDSDTIDAVTPRLLGPHPNCYTYTKRLAETLIANHYPKLPVAVVRPCIVVPAWKEPVPGWVDNLNGPVGLLVGGGKGVIRTMYCRSDYVAEVIPVDYAINAIITFTWYTATNQESFKETPVLNISESKALPVTWGEILEKGKKMCREYPFEMLLWYPDGNIHTNWLVHMLCVIFYHWLPAIMIDMLMVILRQKTFMIRVQRKISEGLRVLQYFTTKQWSFTTDNLKLLKQSMTDYDHQMFPLTTDGFDVATFTKNTVLGARQFLMKEDPKTLPRQRIVVKALYIIDKLVSLTIYLLTIYFVMKWFSAHHFFQSEKYNLPGSRLWSASVSSSL